MIGNDEYLLERLVRELATVPGVGAIALGGSRARGIATERSDYDIGLYYEPTQPLDIAALGRAAVALDDAGLAARVTPIGDWGPWINGGAWLAVDGRRVDLLYRDLGRVRAVIEACHSGRIERHYQPGHPHAFVSVIYMGEVAHGRALWDPAGTLAELRRLAQPYPRALRDALVETFLWEAGFALENARKSLDRHDIAYVAGCSFRAVACLCQTLFAVNDTYLLNEKGAVAAVDRLARRPAEFAVRVAMTFREIGNGALSAALDRLDALVDETRALLA
jgi:hypothetical protein